MHFSRVCCSARMHEDDARWPTVHTTGALSDGTPPDFDAGIRWQADRKKGNAASAIRCLLVSFSPGMLAVMPQLHPNCFQPSEPSSVPSPKPPIRASELPVRSFAWSAVPVAGLLFRATPRHMHCASGRRRLLRTPLGAHHSTMAQWRASWGFRAQGCVCAGAACVRHASAPHSLHIPKCGESAHRVLLRSDMYGGQRSKICEWPAPRPTVRPRAPAADLRRGRHDLPPSRPAGPALKGGGRPGRGVLGTVARQPLVVWTNGAGVIAPLVCPCRNPRPVPFGLRFPGI